MQQQEIHEFLRSFFLQNNCTITEEGVGYFTVQLTVDMDKELMNRPFYWHYLEKIGGVPNPMRITLITEPSAVNEDIKGEVIHFGSPRLHHIFRVAKEQSSHLRLYESILVNQQVHRNVALQPWLGVQLKLTFQSHQTREELHSIGLQLQNGTMVHNFHNRLQQVKMTPKIPDFTFTLSPMIRPQSGMSRIRNWVLDYLQSQDDTWAQKARERWRQDLQLLEQFYEGIDELPETFLTEQKALQEQYEPKIQVETIGGGIFYVSQSFLSKTS
ncbi:YqhG family protein [Bacillus fonticola]|uniref:YqhG family protein n=1 Tax=Bacillus fonticola TaxID=2728853 RepID=UPI0014736246|nr:YqhG family protein [Bacillus fonticola]